MATRLISKSWEVEGVLTDVTSAKLSDSTGTYGIKRNDTDAVVVADGTAMTKSATGTYQYSFTDTVDIAYTAYVEIVYGGDTFYFEVDITARSAAGEMVASYSSLLVEVGEERFGIRTGFSSEQTSKIERCIKHGLRRVYSAHEWSFFKPVTTITTVVGTSAYSLPVAYEGIESHLSYAEEESDYYPRIRQRHDDEIRRMQQDTDDTARPLYFSIRTVEFDPTTGSRRQLILHPTPDEVWVLNAKMTLRATMVDAVNQFPVGGEQLAQLITEACMAAGEHNYDEQPGVHDKQYLELLPLAIQADQRASTPVTLGGDAPKGENNDLAARAVLVGTITLGGEEM